MMPSLTIRFRILACFLFFTFIFCLSSPLEFLLSMKSVFLFPAASASEELTEEVSPETLDALAAQATVQSSFAAVSPTDSAAAIVESDVPVTPSVSFSADDFTGAAHLNYPIVVPVGRDGLAPSLSLAFFE